MSDSQGIILAIESAIGGGSLSLIRDGAEISRWIGSPSTVARAENLLINIDQVLTRADTLINDIDLIAVSAGPGSFTGIRIGIATALGLKAGLCVEIASQSALQAVIHQHAARSPDVLAAIPMGRNAVCIQRFSRITPIDEPRTISETQFLGLIDEERDVDLVVHTELYDKLIPEDRITNTGANIALSIGSLCAAQRDVMSPPLFIAKSF
jgi:tRNA threonylcarbamoyl adenosine modification protein YeaZ